MLERYFGIKAQGSTLRCEIIAGASTFLAAMYIIAVNPSILHGAGIPFDQALTATVLISAFGCLAMGLYAKNPILVAPGMGLNALFTYTMVIGHGMPLPIALGCVFWAGVLFLLLALFNARKYVIEAIPASLRYGIGSGIGLFVTLIGLKNAGLVVSNPATIVGMGDMTPTLAVFLLGLAVTIGLVVRKVPGALVLGIAVTTLLAFPIGRWIDGTSFTMVTKKSTAIVNYVGIVAQPSFERFNAASWTDLVDIFGALKFSVMPFIFVVLFTTFFDALSTFMSVCQAGSLLDENGEPRHLKRSMMVDAFSALVSAPLGTSSANAFIESAAGVSQGGKTGVVAVVCALLFLPFLFLSPLLQLVPSLATAPALVMVGVFMASSIGEVNWRDLEVGIPAFLAMVMIPLTYSITHGIVFGMLSFVVVKVARGKWKEIHPAMWVLFLLSLALFAVPSH